MPQLIIKAVNELGVRICAKLILKNTSGSKLLCDYFDGEIIADVAEGDVIIEITHGKLYRPIHKTLTLVEDYELSVAMKRIADPLQYGFYSFDAHNHVSRQYYDARTVGLNKAAVIAKGEELNILFAGVPYDLENHAEAKTGIYETESYRNRYNKLLKDVSDPKFLLDPANEFCKYRYGHVFMFNYTQTPPVDRYRDPLYHSYELCKHMPSVDEPPFTNLPVSNAVFSVKQEHTVAIFAHPTSWWRAKNSGAFVTNIASTLGFDLLSGAIDGISIMGYHADQKSYRDIWIELLNLGFFVVGVSETDAIMDADDFEMPPYKTYAYAETFSLDSIAAAVKQGKCVVSSGPLLHMTIDGELPGSVLKRKRGERHKCNVSCNACCDGVLSRLEIIKNGEVLETIILDSDRFTTQLEISTPEEDGYILAILYDCAGNMAITNPVYIRNAPFVNRCYRANVCVDVCKGGLPATGIFSVGDSNGVHFDGKVVCNMPPHAPLHIYVDNEKQTIELFWLDSLQSIFRNLYTGAFNADHRYTEGEVPPKAFCINEIKNILDSVKLSISFGVSAVSDRNTSYIDTHVTEQIVEENIYIDMAYADTPLPSFEQFKKALPVPVWQKHESVLRCYDRSWEIAHSKLRKPEPGSRFVANFLYTEFSNSIFMWGLSFVTQFGRYARHSFDFIGCLNNFYAMQHRDGFICRQINIFKGSDEFERFDPSSTGPNIMAWAEWEEYKLSGDVQRLRNVFPALTAYHRWLRKHRTWKDGTYFSSGWGCGMDNQPRMETGYHAEFDNGHMSWIDITAQQILSARTLIKIAAAIGRSDEVLDMTRESEALTDYVNRYMWCEREQFYFDRYKNSCLSTEKTIGAYWLLLADAVPEDRVEGFITHLKRGGAFDAPHRIPSIPVSSLNFDKDGGNYWRGGVWCITNYMVIEGLQRKGYYLLAHDIAKNHVEALAKVFDDTGSIWESYDALHLQPGKCYGKFVRNEFVGFSGIGPITIFIESVLGIKPATAARSLTWHVNLLEEHGVKHYPLGSSGIVSLLCKERSAVNEEPDITVRSTIPITVEVIWDSGRKEIFIDEGNVNADSI